MTYVEAEFLSWSSVSCQVVSCQVARCIVMLENKACWETVFHFRAFQVGNGSSRPPFLPYLLHFEGSAKGRRFSSGVWHTHLQSSEQESSITRPQCRHRLLRSALRSTSLHAVPLCSTLPHNTSEYFRTLQATIVQHHSPPHTTFHLTTLHPAAIAGKQNTPSHGKSLPRRGTWTPAGTRRCGSASSPATEMESSGSTRSQGCSTLLRPLMRRRRPGTR